VPGAVKSTVEVEHQLPKDSHELEQEGGDETDMEGTDSEGEGAKGMGRTGDLTA
jgi:hypothetical protein